MTAQRLYLSNEDYHNSPGVSNSMLTTLLDKDLGPAMYEGLYLSKRFPRVESDAFDIGTVVHDELLSGGGLVLEIPDEVLSKNKNGVLSRTGEAWKQFQAENVGRILIRSQDMEPIREMVASVRRHKYARTLLDLDGESEFPLSWTDPDTGLLRRSRLDRVNDHFIVDIKTTQSVSKESFEKAARDYGYFRQGPFYVDGFQDYSGETRHFAFICVKKTPPYTCMVHELSERLMAAGRTHIRWGLREIVKRTASGDWTNPDDLGELDAPEWFYKQMEAFE